MRLFALILCCVFVSACTSNSIRPSYELSHPTIKAPTNRAPAREEIHCTTDQNYLYFAKIYNSNQFNFVLGEPNACEDLQFLYSYMDEAQHHLPLLPRAKVGAWIFNTESLKDSYDAFGIKIAVELIKGKEQKTRTVFLHEIGHVYFQSWMLEKSPLFAELKSDMQDINSFNQIYYGEGLWQHSGPAFPIAFEALEKKKGIPARKIMKKWQETKHKIERQNKVEGSLAHWALTKLLHYHELFADIFAVTMEDDPAALEKALGSVKNATNLECRSLLFNDPNFLSEDPHCTLSNYRHLIYNNLLLPNKNKPKQDVIKYILTYFQDEFEYFYQKGNLDLAEANLRIKEKFKGKILL